MTKGKKTLLRLCITACLLALALVLPFATGQIPAIGKMLCPMHLPVLICGFVCSPVYAGVIGAIAPILRSVLFTVPKIFPDAPGMCVELMFYGIVSGLLYKFLPKKKPFIYLSLVSAMLVGRVAWGITRLIFLGVWGSPFGWAAFFSGAFAKALPGIIVQIIFVPILVMTIEKEFPYLVTRGSPNCEVNMQRSKKAAANRRMCIGCRLCNPEESPCPANSITFDEVGKVVIDEKTCTGCGLCQKRCPKGIISIQTIHTHE